MKLHLKPFLYAALMAAFHPTAMTYTCEAADCTQTWRGTEDNRQWDTQSTNWGGADESGKMVWGQTYQDGASVRFTNTGAGEVVLVGNLSPAAIEVQNGADFEYTFNGQGHLTGATSLIKKSAGTLSINTDNTYSGGTTITYGTVVAGVQTALGTGAVTIVGGTLNMGDQALANDITVTSTACISGASAYKGNLTLTAGKLYGDTINISSGKTATLKEGTISEETTLTGAGKVIKDTSGTVNMLHAGTYTGGTTIKAGTLKVRADKALGKGSVSLTGGTLDMGGMALTNNVIVNGDNLSLLWASSFNGNLTLEGGSLSGEVIQLASGKTATLKKGTLNNKLQGAGKVVKDTSGTVYMTNSSSYKGGTTLKQGTLTAKSASAFGSGTINMTGGTLNMGGFAQSNDINVNATSATIKGASAYKGNLTLTKGTLSGDTILLANSSKTATLKSGTVKNALTGTGNVVKTTSGTVYLAGKNTYRNTYISAGKLVAKSNSAFGTGNITLTGGTLDMAGKTVSNNIYVDASKASIKGGSAYKGKLIITQGTLSGDAIRLTKDTYVRINKGAINNKLTGAGRLTKETKGTATIAGANTYTGNTYLKAGTLAAKSASAFGTGTIYMLGGTLNMGAKALGNTVSVNGSKAPIKGGSAFKGNLLLIKGTVSGDAINLASGKTATVKEGTVSNKLTGAGKLIKQGSGAAVISGANSYKGGTVLDGGTLTIKTATSLGTGTVTLNRGTLDMAGKAISNTLAFNSSATIKGTTAFKGNLRLAQGTIEGQSINLQKGKTATLQKGSVKITLTGNGKVVKDTEETAYLYNSNTYKGGTTVKAGTLTARHVKAFGTGDITLAGGMLNLRGFAVSNNITVKCDKATLFGPSCYKGSLTLEKGALDGGMINFQEGKKTYLQSGSISNSLVGKGDVYKTGTGTVTLTGETYLEGDTYVKGGTLALEGTTFLLGTTRTYNGGTLDVRTNVTLGNLYLGGGKLALTAGKRLFINDALTLAKPTKIVPVGVTTDLPALIKFRKLENTSNMELAQFFGISSSYRLVAAGRNLAVIKNSPALAMAAAAAEEDYAMVDFSAYETYSASLDALGQSAWGTARAARLFDHTVRNHAQAQSAALDGKGKRSVWFAAMSGFSHVDDAADFSTSGGAVGMQFNGSMGGNAGIAIGQTYGRVSPAGTSRVKQQTQHAAIYGTKMLYTSATDSVSLTGTASYGTTDSDYHQDDHGFDWTQHSAVLGVRGTWEHKLGQSTGVYGFAGLEYLATDSGDTENGRSGSVQALRGSFGAGISHTEGRLTLHADAAFTPDMVNHAPVAESDGIRSGVRNPGRFGWEVNVGASYRLSDKWSLNAGYTYHNEKHADSHNAHIGARCTF